MERKYFCAGQATDENTAHAHGMLDTQGYTYTLRICNSYCLSATASVVRINTRDMLYREPAVSKHITGIMGNDSANKYQARRCTYELNVGTRSRNHCRRGKAMRITYRECMFVALGIQHAQRLRCIVNCGLSVSTIFSHIT